MIMDTGKNPVLFVQERMKRHFHKITHVGRSMKNIGRNFSKPYKLIDIFDKLWYSVINNAKGEVAMLRLRKEVYGEGKDLDVVVTFEERTVGRLISSNCLYFDCKSSEDADVLMAGLQSLVRKHTFDRVEIK